MSETIDFLAYHQSLAKELDAVKDRVRHLIRHWPTDGSFKESVLRSVLRRYLPESLFIGTGFVVTATECSKQFDILILDKERPRLFWDGDLVIVTPDAVQAVIEVKTGLDRPVSIEETITSLAIDKATWHRAPFGWNNWLGLFVFEARGDHGDSILQSLDKVKREHNIKFDCVAYGPNLLVDSPARIGKKEIKGFVSQQVDGLAAACFITKLVARFSRSSIDSNPMAWQPLRNREVKMRYLPEDGEGRIESLEQDP